MLKDASIFRAGLFLGKKAFITGSTGIGLVIAAELRALGADVIIGSRKEANLKKGRAELETIESPGLVEQHVCNIREPESIEQAVKYAIEKFGRIDFLINNAGGQFPSPAAMISKKGW
ncbi:MAG: SDR family NAD(P)-dependent oxidoreductase, partial [Deltaproteobacteria bacterium]|nr:SDR family NAD(P)-dependent oxidoreductase [Deltaproteobacteria bacterium]